MKTLIIHPPALRNLSVKTIYVRIGPENAHVAQKVLASR